MENSSWKLSNSKKDKHRDYSTIKYIKTKKIPVEIELKRKDGKIIKIKATKIVRCSPKTSHTKVDDFDAIFTASADQVKKETQSDY